MYEITKTEFSDGTLIVKCPSMSVVVPIVVPSTKTPTPVSAVPVFSSVIVPFIGVAADTDAVLNISKVAVQIKLKNSLFRCKFRFLHLGVFFCS